MTSFSPTYDMIAYLFSGAELADTLHAPCENAVAKIDAASAGQAVLAPSYAEARALRHDFQTGYRSVREITWGRWVVRVVAPDDVRNAKKKCVNCGLPKLPEDFAADSPMCLDCSAEERQGVAP